LEEVNYKNYLLWLLSTRDYSRSQLLQKLKRRGCEKNSADMLIDELIQAGMYQEKSYTRARSRGLISKNYSARGVYSKLRQERVPITATEVGDFFTELSLNDSDVADRLLLKALPKTFSETIDVKNLQKDKKLFMRLQRRFAAKGLSVRNLLDAIERLGKTT